MFYSKKKELSFCPVGCCESSNFKCVSTAQEPRWCGCALREFMENALAMVFLHSWSIVHIADNLLLCFHSLEYK